MPVPTRTSVFISYSHADSQWLRLFNTHLKPLVRDQKLEIWSDQKIRKGERWRDRIHKQMATARVGIFLVSADFLASDFIHAEELPPLLRVADREGATLLTICQKQSRCCYPGGQSAGCAPAQEGVTTRVIGGRAVPAPCTAKAPAATLAVGAFYGLLFTLPGQRFAGQE